MLWNTDLEQNFCFFFSLWAWRNPYPQIYYRKGDKGFNIIIFSSSRKRANSLVLIPARNSVFTDTLLFLLRVWNVRLCQTLKYANCCANFFKTPSDLHAPSACTFLGTIVRMLRFLCYDDSLKRIWIVIKSNFVILFNIYVLKGWPKNDVKWIRVYFTFSDCNKNSGTW